MKQEQDRGAFAFGRWLLTSCGLCFCMLLSVLAFGGCQHDDVAEITTPNEGKRRRTVLVYMAAQNSLGVGSVQTSGGYRGFQWLDSLEMARGCQYINDDDRLLVFMDDNCMPRLYRFTAKGATLVHSWNTDINSTSPAVFQNILEWTKEHYPAEEYGLVMWSHADGWLPSTNTDYSAARGKTVRPTSFGIDDGKNMGSDSGTQMNITDMATAIEHAGLRMRYIFFDACLMQNVEVDYALRNAAEYVVACPIATPAFGADYEHQLRDGLFSDNPADIAATYKYDVENESEYGDFGVVISCVRTDKMQAVADALKETLPLSSLVGKQSPDMSGVLNYHAYAYSYYYRPHYYDASCAVRNIMPAESAERVVSAIEEAVVYKAATSRFWIGPGIWAYQNVDADIYSGISMFVPQNAYTYNSRLSLWGDLNACFRSTTWYNAAGWAQTGW